MKEMEEVLNDQVGNKLVTESYELVERTNVDMFTIVKCEHGCFIAVGQSRLTDYMPYEICEKWINERNWILIFSLATLIVKNEQLA